ncbi:MAG: hypothetical protein LC114_07535 [Bryobacterales bacterium]|nr:hypothetical protein [Bryobacterales bacterium]
MKDTSALRAGDWVQVRSKEEILATLDKEGQLDGLPFMPEMLEYCGRRFQVFKRAHKTCDPPNGVGGRRMPDAVHLEAVRCDGSAHGGCQARCLIFWKEKWLTRLNGPDAPEAADGQERPSSQNGHIEKVGVCAVHDLFARACFQSSPDSGDGPTYVCQSTQIANATQPLPWWDLRQFAEDYTSGNVRLREFVAALAFSLYEAVASAGVGFGSPLRWLYDKVQLIRGGTPYPMRHGKLPRGVKTPSEKLNLNPGDLVKVRSYPEILETLNSDSHNRGMYFDAEMVPFCGGTYQVLDRIEKIINEKTGKMQHLKNDCIMLEGVVCRACYAKHRRFCPRSIYAYWREIWLERVACGSKSSASPPRIEDQYPGCRVDRVK